MKIRTDLSDDYFRKGQIGDYSTKRWRAYTKRNPGKDAKRQRDRKPPARIAVLDFETDPFDNVQKFIVRPFLAILYSEDIQPIILWDNEWRALIDKVHTAIKNLPDHYIIYAHNGGKFDYMFLIHLLRGEVMFKGRGLMTAKIGEHELRDSIHILPGKLQDIGGKDAIDYSWMTIDKREKHRQQIIDYCLADCVYLYDVVKAFRAKYGSPLTIGQAAMRELKREYPDVEHLSEYTDGFLRTWFHGGRVQCFHYGVVSGAFNLYDVNSMYPFVMARRMHPISSEFFIGDRVRADYTAFITLRCKNNGALVSRTANGLLTTECRDGIFDTTIHEYETALAYGLITDCEIIRTIDFKAFTNFSRFVEPIYASRQENKRLLDAEIHSMGNRAKELRYNVLFEKLLLNNAYGKFAQNPRRFKNHWIGADGEPPPTSEWGFTPEVNGDDYSIYSKPVTEFRFNNVATAASITGAARAELLAAIATSRDILYCDTDSIICGRFSDSLDIDPYKLGSWDKEAPIDTFIGNGKKLYAYQRPDKEPPKNRVIRAKGSNDLTWDDMLSIADGKVINKTMTAPTIGKDGSQVYITREIRQTGIQSAA